MAATVDDMKDVDQRRRETRGLLEKYLSSLRVYICKHRPSQMVLGKAQHFILPIMRCNQSHWRPVSPYEVSPDGGAVDVSRTDETACFMILKTCHNVQRRAGRRLELMLIEGVSPLPLVHGETSYHMMRLVIKAARSVKYEGSEDHDDLPTRSIYPGFRCTAVNVNAVAQNISHFVDVEHIEVR